jgi:hypothetical protein
MSSVLNFNHDLVKKGEKSQVKVIKLKRDNSRGKNLFAYLME